MDELYILARSVLLDALDALRAHRASMIVVGAQAVYLRVGEADIAVAPFTTDGDLAIDPTEISEAPPLERLLRGAGFEPKVPRQPGVWTTERSTPSRPSVSVSVDLLVPTTLSATPTRRAARLRGHDAHAARNVDGLEGAIVDCNIMEISALGSADPRRIEMRVAGPSALVVAKLIKIAERLGTDRLRDKDALDVLRLLRGSVTRELARKFELLLKDPRSRAATSSAFEVLQSNFRRRDHEGIRMVLRAVGGLANHDEIAQSCMFLVEDLLTATRTTREGAERGGLAEGV